MVQIRVGHNTEVNVFFVATVMVQVGTCTCMSAASIYLLFLSTNLFLKERLLCAYVKNEKKKNIS